MEVRQQNAAIILREIERRPGITNGEIAQEHALSVPTISNIVNILKNCGMIMAVGTGASSGGRRPKQLSISPDYQDYIGVSIARHTIYLVLIDFAGNILKKERFYRNFTGDSDYWAGVADLIETFRSASGGICRTGVALPGFVDQVRDRVYDTYTLGVEDILLEDVYAQLGGRVTVGDSCRLAGLAQIFRRTDDQDFFFVLLNRRISGVLVQGDEIFGLRRSSFDIGAMIIDPEERTSDYGIPGSFLELCSASRIIDTVRKDSDVVNYDRFFEVLADGNQMFAGLWARYIRHLATALHNLYAVFGVDMVIGGEMARYLEPFALEIKKGLPEESQDMHIFFSDYGAYDDAFGAALSARGDHLSERIPEVIRDAANMAEQPGTKRRGRRGTV